MAKYRVMQISMTDEQVEEINSSVQKDQPYPGWYKRRLATTMSPTADAVFEAWDQYKSVAMIDADNLEHVFEIGNMGPEHRITRHGPPMHSVSVGDVVVDPACSTAWFVDTCGFGMLGTVYHGKAMGYGN
jgi:hypothetical protein|tara:strand:- start:115 stop:504 length:390 start_codon:yes stop_codon:yes gene_type:complete